MVSCISGLHTYYAQLDWRSIGLLLSVVLAQYTNNRVNCIGGVHTQYDHLYWRNTHILLSGAHS